MLSLVATGFTREAGRSLAALLIAGLGLVSPAAGQDTWHRVVDPPETRPPLAVAEFGGRTRLIADGERLLRVHGTIRAVGARSSPARTPGDPAARGSWPPTLPV